MAPSLSKQVLGEATNSSSIRQSVSQVHQQSAVQKTIACSSRRTLPLARPPRARRTSLIPSAKPLYKSSSTQVKKASTNDASEASLLGRDKKDAVAVAVVAPTVTVVQNETAKSSSQQQQTSMQQLQEENLHLKIDKFHLLKELHYAYSMFVATGHRCAHLESENKQLRQEQESLAQNNNNNNNDHKKMMHDDDDSSHDDNDENIENDEIMETKKTLV